jgi:hypothetical protein
MSYARMDHAGWVEGNIAATRRTQKKTRADNQHGWAAAPDKLSDFQAKVMDILGMVGGGIYNAPIAWDRVCWRTQGLGVPWNSGAGLATVDNMDLTRLVFLCHEARIRCSVRSNGPRGLYLLFHERSAEGGFSERHPNLDEAVAAFSDYLPADHRVLYRPAADVMPVAEVAP